MMEVRISCLACEGASLPLQILSALHCSITSIASQVALVVKNPPANAEDVGSPWVGKIPWKRKWQPIPVSVPGEFQGQRSWVGDSPQGRKESDMTERLNHHRQWVQMANSGEAAGPCAGEEPRGPERAELSALLSLSLEAACVIEKLSLGMNYGPFFLLMAATCFCPEL